MVTDLTHRAKKKVSSSMYNHLIKESKMKKIVIMFAALFTMTTAMAQEDCCKNKAEKTKTEKQCGGDCPDCKEHQQEGRLMGQRPDRTKMMVEELKLDETQAAKVKELNEKYADVLRGDHHGMHLRPQKMERKVQVDGETGATTQVEKARMEKPQMDKKRADRPEMKKMMEERREKMQAYEEELKQILSEEQFKAYQENKKDRRPAMHRMPRRIEKE